MPNDDWDRRIDYLRNTRRLYYNDDYLDFLVRGVWKLDKPVRVVDFGCGYGFLGLKLLPLLPEGSTYTGIDKGHDLIATARETFGRLPYASEFIEADLLEIEVERRFDLAVCHAFLLHMAEPERMLGKMIGSVADGGRVIAFEPHWIAGMAGWELDGVDASRIVRLGALQKLYEEDAKRSGKNGNVGIRLPILMSRLGLAQVECRASDKVNFLDPDMDLRAKELLYQSLREEGVGQPPGDRDDIISRLAARGLTPEEASAQYEAERRAAEEFGSDSAFVYAPQMKITFGTVSGRASGEPVPAIVGRERQASGQLRIDPEEAER
ncbi:class I SAM-dependent methyltransferase [Cohnella zeiphila]|uniref:Class I SAM-dependent methyltransferase n=1 Tax=Cohnella zeiphila TaxID=2761120 RepID=A0A7X0SS76_9BACL|nr:class I SAM-dependent methyltransferase [Cohnella zeiphila]MBB6735151.1 class I SAM-dependent methyltransferase [Cohnella zeiphila]